jgi:uracil-DNA glycosylase
VQASCLSKILIIGQAPGLKVQNSGIPWDDQSGNELRRWLNVTKEQFYNPDIFALMPMGFCYPGKGVSGDLPPRFECAPLWHQKLIDNMKGIRLTILIGQYAQKYYLGENFSTLVTENVRNYKQYLPNFLPLVHPSPRNKIWQKRNLWFEEEIIPILQRTIREFIDR